MDSAPTTLTFAGLNELESFKLSQTKPHIACYKILWMVLLKVKESNALQNRRIPGSKVHSLQHSKILVFRFWGMWLSFLSDHGLTTSLSWIQLAVETWVLMKGQSNFYCIVTQLQACTTTYSTSLITIDKFLNWKCEKSSELIKTVIKWNKHILCL